MIQYNDHFMDARFCQYISLFLTPETSLGILDFSFHHCSYFVWAAHGFFPFISKAPVRCHSFNCKNLSGVELFKAGELIVNSSRLPERDRLLTYFLRGCNFREERLKRHLHIDAGYNSWLMIILLSRPVRPVERFFNNGV